MPRLPSHAALVGSQILRGPEVFQLTILGTTYYNMKEQTDFFFFRKTRRG